MVKYWMEKVLPLLCGESYMYTYLCTFVNANAPSFVKYYMYMVLFYTVKFQL